MHWYRQYLSKKGSSISVENKDRPVTNPPEEELNSTSQLPLPQGEGLAQPEMGAIG
jgi:hypothetical protein